MIWKLVVSEQGLLALQEHLLGDLNLVDAEAFAGIEELRICTVERLGSVIEEEGPQVRVARLLKAESLSRGARSSQLAHTVVLEVCDDLRGRHVGDTWGEKNIPLKVPTRVIIALWEVVSRASK